MGVFYLTNEPTHYILLIGWQGPIEIDYELIEQTLAEPDIKRDLAEISLDDPVKLLSCFVAADRPLDEFLVGDVVNTENFPVLEFESPKYGYSARAMIDNLNDLVEIRISPRRFLKPGSIPPEALNRLERYEQALPWIVQGHLRCLRDQFDRGTLCYMEALKLTPDDESLNELLEFDFLKKLVLAERANPVPPFLLGRAYMLQGTEEKLRRARALFGRAESLFLQKLRLDLDPRDEVLLLNARRWRAEIDQRLGELEPAP
jgi:hypothetical protein